jgi:hypothetical protein
MIIILLLWICVFQLDSVCRTINLGELFHDFMLMKEIQLTNQGAGKTYEVNFSVPCTQTTLYNSEK